MRRTDDGFAFATVNPGFKIRLQDGTTATAKDLATRCDVCGKPFRAKFVDGKLVDYDDETQFVTGDRFAHKRCVETEESEK